LVKKIKCNQAIIVGEMLNGSALEQDPDRTLVPYYAFAAMPAPKISGVAMSMRFDRGCFCQGKCSAAGTDERNELTEFDDVITANDASADATAPLLLLATTHSESYAAAGGVDPVTLYFSEPVESATLGTGILTVEASNWNGVIDAVATTQLEVKDKKTGFVQ
jgi:hypothetical protein